MKALDLFAGAGGWDVAASALGWTVDGVELMPEAVATRDAVGFATRWRDVRDVETDPGEYDVLIASPPCQTFSNAGTGTGRRALTAVLHGVAAFRRGDPPSYADLAALTGDERTALVLEPLRVALAAKSLFIAWEQVPAVLPAWRACADVLRDHGYSVWTGMLHAEQYGVPQTRKRAVLIARRDGRVAAPPAPTHSRYHARDPQRLDDGVLPWVSMADALGWGLTDKPSPTVCGGGSDSGGAKPFGPSTRRELRTAVGSERWAMRNGNQAHSAERPIEYPAPTIHFGARCNDVRWVQRSNYSRGGIPGQTAAERGRVTRELDQPSSTITGKAHYWAGDGDPTSSAGTRVTPEEAATLQTFPPEFPFRGGKGKRYQQIGNAVPPLLALAVLQEFTR